MTSSSLTQVSGSLLSSIRALVHMSTQHPSFNLQKRSVPSLVFSCPSTTRIYYTRVVTGRVGDEGAAVFVLVALK